jgi:hypothetical protein
MSTRGSIARLTAAVLVAGILGACEPELLDPFAAAKDSFTETIHVELSAEHPIERRDLLIHIDVPGAGNATETQLSAQTVAAGVRLTATMEGDATTDVSDDRRPLLAFLRFGGCPGGPTCDRVVHLIAERADPLAPDASFDVAIDIRTISGRDVPLAAGAMTVTMSDPGGPEAPALVDGTVEGVEVLDPDHPLAEFRIASTFRAGTVEDPSQLVGESVFVIDSDVAATAEVRAPNGLRRVSAGGWTGVQANLDECMTSLAECTQSWTVQLVGTTELVAPLEVHWRLIPRLTDYGVATAPRDRRVSATVETERVAPDATGISHRIQSTTVLDTTDVDPPWLLYGMVATDPLAAFTKAGKGRAVRTESLTVSALERTGAHTRERPMFVGLGFYEWIALQPDGQQTTYRRNTVTSCFSRLSPDCGSQTRIELRLGSVMDGSEEAEAQHAEMIPVTVTWSLDVRVVPFGDGTFPDGSDFTLEPIARN